MSKAGLIINPDAGKDVRRFVSYATYSSNFTKVELGKRVVSGFNAAGVEEVLVMHDHMGLGEDVVVTLEKKVSSKLTLVPTRCTGTVSDTVEAASKMVEMGVDVIVAIGGDGTLRAVFKGARDTPLTLVSAGTNNVTGAYYDATLVGYAAGIVATQKKLLKIFARRAKLLKVLVNNTLRDIALIDVAGVSLPYTGAKAIVDPEYVNFAVFTKGEPLDIGLASIVGFYDPTSFEDDHGYYMEFDTSKGIPIKAVPMPGIFKVFYLKKALKLKIGEKVLLPRGIYTLALDGEREIEVGEDDFVEVTITREGPLLLNIPKILKYYSYSSRIDENTMW